MTGMSWVTKLQISLVSLSLTLAAAAGSLAAKSDFPLINPPAFARYNVLQSLDLPSPMPLGMDLAFALQGFDPAKDSFQYQVIDDLISLLNGWPALLADDVWTGTDDSVDSPGAIVAAILDTDASEWQDVGDAPTDSTDNFAAVIPGSGGGPLMFAASGGGAYTPAGWLRFYGQDASGASSHSYTLTGLDDPSGVPRVPKHPRPLIALGSEWKFPGDTSPFYRTTAAPSAAAPVPLPPGTLGAALTLAAVIACLSRRNPHNAPH